jgi:uncharacterized membrane protein HdeD (DUF308 family)
MSNGVGMLHTLARNWWAILLRGICAILFGLAAFAWPGITLAALVLVYGAYALADGVLAVFWSIFKRRTGAFPWGAFLAGLVSIAVGVLTFLWPGITALALLYLIAAWAIVRGIFEIVAAVHLRKELDNEWLLALSGLASVALGVLLFLFPGPGVLAVLWWIGAFAIVAGVLTVILAFRLRGEAERLEARPAPRPTPTR